MGNVNPPNKDVHRVYDLKGSLVGRSVEQTESTGPMHVLKDINWIQNNEKLLFGPLKASLLIDQLEVDVAFLRSARIMDYSLLVGIHDMITGNKEKIRDANLAEFVVCTYLIQPDEGALKRKRTKRTMKRSSSSGPDFQTNPTQLPRHTPDERKLHSFYCEHGGFQGSDQENNPIPILYFIGVIDIFTRYGARKSWRTFSRVLLRNGRT